MYFLLTYTCIRQHNNLTLYIEFEQERLGPNRFNSVHTVETIGFDLNETKQLIDEISIEKLLKYDKEDFYCEMKRYVELHVYESSVLKYLSQLCTKKINVNFLSIFLPIAKEDAFVTRLKVFLKNELIHVSVNLSF